ncbi:restriction endonuclease [Natronomonas sp. F2-12]|uniref:Restriction endonuclease n=1 Tax=Natronomonas aquatica TaxID=2841590 RepID=A0A9R1CVG2_9EURY|nr:restriction endonuclease [Natronomonas aquatica]
MLSETTESRDSLRVGSVQVESSGAKLVIKMSARYKPENPEEYETDRWGYTATELLPAMEFVGLDEKTRALLEEFVPYAVEEAGGFAEFRENATTTKSLIDRLKTLTLPQMKGIENDLERYLKRKGEAKELEKELNETNNEIDDIVYELFNLVEEDVEIIESSLDK